MKKTRWIIVGLTAVLTVAVYINWKYSSEGGDYPVASGDDNLKVYGGATYVSSESSYFDNARYSRSKNRSDAVAVLNELIENDDADASSRKLAAETVACYAQITQDEATVENLILSKGYEDCVVFLTEETASVVVETLGLEPHEAAQIMDIVSSATGFTADVIKIIEFNSVQN
ncbi:MAG: SpoIIIAH-like family protein [Clostridia bacterium]|nr:SpoIIIAH-like family protein [Clostridia bacterium]